MSIARVGHSKQEMLGGNWSFLFDVVFSSFIPFSPTGFYFRVKITCLLLTGFVFSGLTFRGNGASLLRLC